MLSFGKLKVLIDNIRIKNRTYCWCKCECKNYKLIVKYNLTKKLTVSCGCKKYETTHGLINHPLYTTWGNMKNRCYNPRGHNYNDYGGRGITVCNEWKNNFQSFFNWSINNGYKKELSIDRIDNNGNYRPDNCRWVNRLIQGKNKRNNVVVLAFGESKIISEWARDTRCMVKEPCLGARIKRGWNAEKAITTKNKKRVKV